MTAIKAVHLTSEPPWHDSRMIAATPGEVELVLEGLLVHVRVQGPGHVAQRFRRLFGEHFALRDWMAVVYYDDSPAPQPAKGK